MIKFLTLFLFSLNCFADTGFAYAPMTAGNSITYQVFAMTGQYNATTGAISVTSNTYQHNVTITYSNNFIESVSPTWNLFVNYYHPVGSPAAPIDFSQTLQDSKWILDNQFQYLGELVTNVNQTITPPEAKLSLYPYVGEKVDAYSKVRVSPQNPTIIIPSQHWRYQTIGYHSNWGGFVDCWRTGLREFNSERGAPPDRVYNYVFMKNKGMVNFWYGDLNGTTVTGHQFYAIQY